jgi:uncharacterized membrane protein
MAMDSIDNTIEVDVPVCTAYDQWTQFESFPELMDGVQEATQITAARTLWRTEIGGFKREFHAEITEQVPDRLIAWRSVDGPDQGGVVSFAPTEGNGTRIALEIDYEPEGLAEKAGDKLGVVGHRIKADLKSFKEFIETRHLETGAWSGQV